MRSSTSVERRYESIQTQSVSVNAPVDAALLLGRDALRATEGGPRRPARHDSGRTAGEATLVTEGRHPVAVAGLKTVHTVIFAGELSAILWLVVSGLVGRRDRTVGFAAAAVAAEAAVFLANDRVCPITPLTERLGDAHGSVSDIFLPNAVARTIPIWSTALLVIAGVLHLRALVGSRR